MLNPPFVRRHQQPKIASVHSCMVVVMAIASMQLLLAVSTRADEWPHFRGPNRDGVISSESGLPRWNPQHAWTARVGEGGSSPLIIEGRVYTIGYDGRGDTLACRRLDDGKVIWSQRYDGPRYGRHSTGDKSLYSGVSATPEYDPATGWLYTLNTDGELRCWDSDDGKLQWRLNLYDRYQAPRRPDVGGRRSLRDYGYTASPLVHGDWLLVEVGSPAGTVVAFDKRNGKQLWSSECRDEAGHTAGPTPLVVDGEPALVVLTLRNLVVISLAPNSAGRTIGKASWTTDFGNNISSPAVRGNSIVVTSAYNQYAVARFDVSKSGLKRRWRTDGVASGVCSPIISGAHIYWAWRGVHCVDFETGKLKWVGGKVGSAASCILTADKRLVVLADRGVLTLVDAAEHSPNAYHEHAKLNTQLTSDVWPHLALADDRLLCNDRKGVLKCYRLRSR